MEPLPAQEAHQPAADENMGRIEGNGARQFAKGFHPPDGGGVAVEDVQRLGGQQAQHQRRIEPRAMGDDVDGAAALGGSGEPVAANQEGHLQRRVEAAPGERLFCA